MSAGVTEVVVGAGSVRGTGAKDELAARRGLPALSSQLAWARFDDEYIEADDTDSQDDERYCGWTTSRWKHVLVSTGLGAVIIGVSVRCVCVCVCVCVEEGGA